MKKLALIAVAAALSACATARIDLRYQPKVGAEPLSGRLPKLFFSEIDDRTTPGVPIYAGVGATSNGVLTRPLSESVSEALRAELASMGVTLVSARDQAEAILKTAVTQAAASLAHTSAANEPVSATLSLAVQLRSLAGDVLWTNEVTGRGAKVVFAPGLPGNAPNAAMNQALADAMGRFRQALIEDNALARAFGTAAVARTAPRAEPARPTYPASDLDELPDARSPLSNSHAVIIGIERYREKLPEAKFAASDARLAAEYFRRVLGVPDANIARLLDDHATKSDFEKYFERWLPNRVRGGDTVYVYYSGHGAPNPKTGDAYLVPYDADPTYIDEGGYPIKKMYESLAKLPAKKIVVVMDSCFSGAGGRSVIASGARPLVSVQAAEVPSNLTVISASAGDQISNSYEAKGHGLFTYFFLKGLMQKGDDLKAVYAYLKPEVSDVARREYNADQDPQWRGAR